MIRYAAAAVVVLCISPPWLSAQGLEMTVTATSAAVYKSASTGSPVLGSVPRGAVLEVTYELGSWVKILWPSAPDGSGYVHLSTGSLNPRPIPSAPLVSPAQPVIEQAPLPAIEASASVQPSGRAPSGNPSVFSVPSHQLGVGVRLGGTSFGIGAGVRAWPKGPLGIQFDVTRYATYNSLDFGRMTSTQFSPSALYSFGDHVSDYTWLRPFVGGGATFHRSSLTSPGVGFAVSDSTLGFQTFGGSEFTLAAVPQLAVSLEGSYHWLGAPFAGYELGGVGFGVAGHWYFR
jgi:hypothetical protein